MKPTRGIGMWTYNLYLNILSWRKEDLIKFMKMSTGKRLKALDNEDKLSAFDVVTLLEPTRQLLQEAMAFFI